MAEEKDEEKEEKPEEKDEEVEEKPEDEEEEVEGSITSSLSLSTLSLPHLCPLLSLVHHHRAAELPVLVSLVALTCLRGCAILRTLQVRTQDSLPLY